MQWIRITILLLPLYISSCRNDRAVDLKKISWISGKWQCLDQKDTLVEIWEFRGDTVFDGHCELVSTAAKHAEFSETLQIGKRGNDLFYFATVKGQNNGKTIPFKLISSDNNELVFTNPEHDYPDRICYKKISDNKLVVRVSGKNSPGHEEIFDYTRIK